MRMLTAGALCLGLVSPLGLAQDADGAPKVVESIEALYEGLGGCVVNMTHVMEAPGAPFMLPEGGQAYGALVVRPNLVRSWAIPGDRGVMTMNPGVDSMAGPMVQSFGDPLNIYEVSDPPEDFSGLLGGVVRGERARSAVPMLPGLSETLSMFTDDGFVVGGAMLSELEYAGIEGEDVDLTHVFRGETNRGGDEEPQPVEVRFNAVGKPWLMSVITEGNLRVMMGQEENVFVATMTTLFSDWRGIPEVDLTSGREEVDNLGEAMDKRMQKMHGSGQN